MIVSMFIFYTSFLLCCKLLILNLYSVAMKYFLMMRYLMICLDSCISAKKFLSPWLFAIHFNRKNTCLKIPIIYVVGKCQTHSYFFKILVSIMSIFSTINMTSYNMLKLIFVPEYIFSRRGKASRIYYVNKRKTRSRNFFSFWRMNETTLFQNF